MRKVVFLVLFIFLGGCKDKVNVMKSKIEIAENDGFEVVAIFNNNAKSVKYKNIKNINESNVSFFLPLDSLDYFSKSLEIADENKKVVIDLKVKPIEQNRQDVCLEYHYTKSTYIYCYTVSGQNIIPKYSEYHDMSRKNKTVYE